MLSDARAQLAKEGRVLDAVAVQSAAVVLTPERTGAIAVSGGLPVYLISDGYAARIDPDVAQSNRVEVRDSRWQPVSSFCWSANHWKTRVLRSTGSRRTAGAGSSC